jgi:hypothetical protein
MNFGHVALDAVVLDQREILTRINRGKVVNWSIGLP